MAKFCLEIEDPLNNYASLTLNEIKYLKIIFNYYENNKTLNLTSLSRIIGIKPSSAVDTINNLINKNLLVKEKRKLKLTNKGVTLCKFITMKRRLLELFFFYVLDLDPKTAKKEAEKIDFLVSCETIEKIVEKLLKRKINIERCLHDKKTYVKEFITLPPK